MRQTPDKMQELIMRLKGKVNWRSLVITLSAIVVFVTTYLLILPAITLDKDEAIRQGGTDIAVEQTVDDPAGDPGEAVDGQAEEDADVQTVQDDAEQPAEETGGESDEPADPEGPAETASEDSAGEPEIIPVEKAETPAAERDEIGLLTGSKELTADTEESAGFTVSAVVGEANNVPADVSLQASELTKDTEGFDYDEHYDEALKALKKDDSKVEKIKMIRFYDISLESDTQDESVEPSDKVSVKIEYENGIRVSDADNIRIVHFGDKKTEVLDAKDNKVEATVDEKNKLTEASFETDGFSEYAVAEVETIDKYVLSSDGHNYHISVTYAPDSGIPEGADLAVEEITGGASVNGKSYEEYVAETEKTLGWDSGTASFARVFDISIEKDGKKVQPAKGKTVDVHIELADAGKEKELNVVHFNDGSSKGDVMESATDGKAVSFEAGSFSAYAIVQGPEPVPVVWHKVSSLEEFISKGSTGVYISHTNTNNTSNYFFFGNSTISDASRTGIEKIKPAVNTPPTDRAAMYYFEPAGADNKFYAYCYSDNGTKQYVFNGNNNSLSFTDEAKTAFTVTKNGDGSFKLNNGDWYWNMQGGNNGSRFCSYNNATDVNNNMFLWYRDEYTGDPYGLDGTSYGLMNWIGGVAGKAMMAENGGDGNTLKAKALTVMSKSNNSSQLFVPKESDISMWTFHWAGDDMYCMTAVVDGSTMYLKIESDGLSLVSDQSDASKIQVVPGSGTHAGEICLKSGGTTLTFSGTVDGGFSVGGSAGSEWLHLVTEDELTNDYYQTYSAEKVSVSDESITNGSRVIVYTRSWNEEKLRYDYYAISSDGSLIPVYESGDSIEWVGGQFNDLLWNFVEHYWEGTNDPNYYYDFYNQYSEKYLAPQVTGNQILSDDPIGVNLNGRRNGKYYSTILAWDDGNYSYAGFKVENGKIVACPKEESMDFYFAIMQDLNVDDELNTVATVDNEPYGITMKMVDFNGHVAKHDDTTTTDLQHSVIGNSRYNAQIQWHGVKNLLSTDLSGGYPTAKNTGKSLSELFGDATEVNNLFIQSTYDETGYFAYDSTQNFASLHDNDFVVYKELGTMDTASVRETMQHGQFMPYNDLETGVFASVNGKNIRDIRAKLLPDDDPRKNEQIYLIRDPDHYFGMELEASFTQTPSGKDAWGHDIIFEFTGDDDFWLYVDGELVIDLGGIHSALPGSVNFRTGEVNENGTITNLRAVFERNFRERNPGATDEEVAAYLSGYFEEGSTVFRDDTTHTMKLFFMERGAGASNLKMRFNLAAVRKGTVQLSKELTGVDEGDLEAEFPYQILYKKADGTEEYLKNTTSSSSQTVNYVFYKDTTIPVKYKDSATIGGIAYNDVFFLMPGETADIKFPDEAESYRIVECGVNPDVYESVTVNKGDETVTPVQRDNGREDYGIEYATTDDRPKVKYVNAVNPDALSTISIQKKLYKENGTTPIRYQEDDTEFTFRLYLSSEFDDLELANMHTYHVKDPDGYYCRWDKANKKFVKIGDGITDYNTLTKEQKIAASFTTSINGTISRIPAEHTVEIRNVIPGTNYRVEERPWEIPDGYSFQKYTDGTSSDPLATTQLDGVAGVNGTVTAGSTQDTNVAVCNLKGYGLRVNKVWTDESFMSDRETTYFAVYIRNPHGEGHGYGLEDPIPGTLRAMPYGTSTLYWYWLTLPEPDVAFDHYMIREVEIREGTPKYDPDDASGVVTNEDELVYQWCGPGDQIELKGTQKGESETETTKYPYTVSYEQGTVSDDSNVRVDTVTNDRPGIILKKQDWGGNPLAGAVFTLTEKSSGTLIGTFTSDSNGEITTAFLSPNKNYTLAETNTPQSYHGLEEPLTIMAHGGTVTVNGSSESPEDGNYILTQAEHGHGDPATLTIKNRSYTLSAVKIDGDTKEPLAGVTFALHKEKTVDGVTDFDVNPMPGYENLETDADGVIPKIDNTLPPGSYQLREKATIEGYEMLSGYITFTVSAAGAISLREGAYPEGVTLDETIDQSSGTLGYVMTIPNSQRKKISFQKVDIADTDKALSGAVFDLYKDSVSEETLLYEDLTSGEDGLLRDSSGSPVFELPVGTYYLEEKQAPEGYYPATEPIEVIVTAGDVTYNENTALSNSGRGKSYDSGTGVYTLKISNSTGYILPSSGGIGTTIFYALGSILVLGCGIVLTARRRMNIHK